MDWYAHKRKIVGVTPETEPQSFRTGPAVRLERLKCV
jgi:hypothetical protein